MVSALPLNATQVNKVAKSKDEEYDYTRMLESNYEQMRAHFETQSAKQQAAYDKLHKEFLEMQMQQTSLLSQ